MNRHLIIYLCALLFLLPLAASPQTQQGFVRTLGRPDKKGVALSGVAVRVKGEHNAVLSGEDGTFAMTLPGKKNGEAYVLQQVRKAGYELNELGVIGRQYAFSDKVPLTLVMVSTSQLQADKQRIENTAYQVAERNYKTRMEELERQRDAGSLAAEQYRAEIQSLQDNFEKYQSLIDDLAEHYAHTDYDLLDEHDREINLCIERGDLDSADSLIHALFDPVDVLRRNKEALVHIDQSEAQARQLLAQANEDMDAVLKQQAKDAEYLYQLYTIELARFDNEKAGHYIEIRAELDTTNVEWQNQAGWFVYARLANYPLALSYCQRVLRQSLLQYGEESAWTATGYNNLGMVYDDLSDHAKALEYHQKALTIREKVLGTVHPAVATSYGNIGAVHHSQGDYAKALEYFQKALAVKKKVLGAEHASVATSYNNIGTVFEKSGDYVKALEYFQKALAIRKKVRGPEHPNVAQSYNNIGAVFEKLGDYVKALRCHQLALTIREKVLGPEHPDVATSYNNIGTILANQGDYSKALEYNQKALAIWEKVLGSEHPSVALSYNNIGTIHEKSGDYAQALEYHRKALTIREKALGPEHPDVAQSYHNIGAVYYLQGDYTKALENLQKTLAIWEKVRGPEQPNVAESYGIIGAVYYRRGDYANALEYFQKTLAIWEKVLGPEHPNTKTVRESIDNVRQKMSEE